MRKDDCVKISFIGDLMCEKPFLKASKAGKKYDFSGFLAPCRDLFRESSLVIGNLETPCDPGKAFTKDLFVFNAPPEFVRSIGEAGVGFLTTATNHCLDKGLDGLRQTIRTLDSLGIAHTGTFENPDDKRYAVSVLPDGTRVAVLSYTYGTNYMDNRVRIPDESFFAVNHLTPLYSGRNKVYESMNQSLRARLTRLIPRDLRIYMNAKFGRTVDASFVDAVQEGDVVKEKTEEIAKAISEARKEADLVVVCPHMGGQFRREHGTYVEAFMELFAGCGADLVVGNHPHVVQEIKEFPGGMKAAYCLGNVSMSLHTPYIRRENLPEYSIMLHAYLSGHAIASLTFSILLETESADGKITVHPAADLYRSSGEEERARIAENLRTVYNTFLGCERPEVPVEKEYEISFQ